MQSAYPRWHSSGGGGSREDVQSLHHHPVSPSFDAWPLGIGEHGTPVEGSQSLVGSGVRVEKDSPPHGGRFEVGGTGLCRRARILQRGRGAPWDGGSPGEKPSWALVIIDRSAVPRTDGGPS